MYPRVSVLWLNYNTLHILPLVKRVLERLADLDYPDYELIIVDNASNDGSWEVLRDYITAHIVPKVDVKIQRLSKNYGFTGGYNAAYAMRDEESKYVVLVNTDALPIEEIVRIYVSFMELHSDVGAAQGVVAGMGRHRHKVDSAGGYIDELLRVHFPFRSAPLNPLLKALGDRPLELSFVEGVMPIYRVEYIEEVCYYPNRLYISAGFMYYLEDVLLSLALWNKGYRSLLIPEHVGYHFRSAIVRKQNRKGKHVYYAMRNRLALISSLGTSYKPVVLAGYIRRILISRIPRNLVIKALVDGMRLGARLKRYTASIQVNRAPRLCSGVWKVIREL